MSEDEEEEVDDRPRPLRDFPPRRVNIEGGFPQIVEANYFSSGSFIADREFILDFGERYLQRYRWMPIITDHRWVEHRAPRVSRESIRTLARLLRENRSSDDPHYFISQVENLAGASRRLTSVMNPTSWNLAEDSLVGTWHFFSQDLENLTRHERQWTRSAYYRQARRRYDNHNPFQLG